MAIPEKKAHPQIKSYILRQGRATSGQQNAIDKVWDHYCLDPSKTYDYTKIFPRNAPIIVEIGFGNGSSLAEMANANPDINYLGFEVHRPGVGHLMLLLEEKEITNVKIYHFDAIEVLEQKIPDQLLAGVHLFFPDPWQKRKHHKRRIVRPSFVRLLNKKLKKDGYFHTATDWEHYAKEMVKIFSSSTNGLVNINEEGGFCPRPEYRPLTKFENRGLLLGHGVWDLIFKKIK